MKRYLVILGEDALPFQTDSIKEVNEYKDTEFTFYIDTVTGKVHNHPTLSVVNDLPEFDPEAKY